MTVSPVHAHENDHSLGSYGIMRIFLLYNESNIAIVTHL